MTDRFLRDVRDLPALPAVLAKLLQLVQAEADVREIARTINLDSALTVRLLRVANSSFYGFRQEVSTVQHATVLLGTGTVRNLAFGVALTGLRAHMPPDGPLDPEAFWRHSIAVACGARHLARAAGVDPEEAFVGGLLHDIGKLVLARQEPAAYAAVLDDAAHGRGLLRELEEAAFGTNHAHLGGALCRHWGIPEGLTTAVAAHHQGGGPMPLLALLVGAADEAALLAGLGDGGSPYVELGRPAYAAHRARLLGLIDTLADEVSCLEGLFFDTDFDAFEPFVPVADRPRVRVDVPESEARTLLLLALAARGYVVDDAAPAALTLDLDGAASAGVIPLGELFRLDRLHLVRFRRRLEDGVAAAAASAG